MSPRPNILIPEHEVLTIQALELPPSPLSLSLCTSLGTSMEDTGIAYERD